MFKQAICLVVLCVGVSAGQEATTMSSSKVSAITEIDGRVVSVDAPKNQLTVKDIKEQVVKLRVTKDTTISSSGANSKLVLKDLKPNDPVHIYYTSADHMARQIDVSPAMPMLRDLATH